MKTVREILIKWLKQNRFDGLANGPDDPCGCGLDDIAPCWQDILGCNPAYRHIATEDDPERGIEKGDTYYSTKPKPAAGGKGRPT